MTALAWRSLSGLDVRVLPDRGLDLGAASVDGVPIAWLSGRGQPPAVPVDELVGDRWTAAWGGGLLTTCGLHNVGAPSEGHGLHGTYSHRAATDVRLVEEDGRTVITGVVQDGALVTRRTITLAHVSASVTVDDAICNRADHVVAAPVLYHVNLGAPLWAPGASVALRPAPAAPPTPRDAAAAAALPDWAIAPAARSDAPERVFEHHPAAGADGWCRAIVANAVLGIELTVAWDPAGLPRAHQWVDPAVGALAIEPANCSVLGRAADRAAGRLPTLAPGESRVTRIRIAVTRRPGPSG